MDDNLVYDELGEAAKKALQKSQLHGTTEFELQSLFWDHPLFLGLATEAGEPAFIQKGSRLGTRPDNKNPDFLIFFYGAVSLDIVEVKTPHNTVITLKGALTKTTKDGIEQLLVYDKIFQKCRDSISGGHLSPPRLILVAGRCVSPKDNWTKDCFPQKDLERIARAMENSKYRKLFQEKRLLVTTLATLFKTTQVAKKDQALLSPSAVNRQIGRTLARRILFDAIRKINSKQNPTWKKVSDHLEDPGDRIAEEYSERLLNTISSIILRVPQDSSILLPAMFLSEIYLYEQDGDLPFGRWEHGATYPSLELLENQPSQFKSAVIKQLSRIMAVDRNEDVIGAMSHMGRNFPDLTEFMRSEQVWKDRLPSMYEAKPSSRLSTIMDVNIAYLLAIHGDNSAVDLLNRCAENKIMMADVASWNLIHAYRKPMDLLESLDQKANSDDDKLRRFKSWHQAVYDGYATMLKAKRGAGFGGA